jgi:hypothetical protein
VFGVIRQGRNRASSEPYRGRTPRRRRSVIEPGCDSASRPALDRASPVLNSGEARRGFFAQTEFDSTEPWLGPRAGAPIGRRIGSTNRPERSGRAARELARSGLTEACEQLPERAAEKWKSVFSRKARKKSNKRRSPRRFDRIAESSKIARANAPSGDVRTPGYTEQKPAFFCEKCARKTRNFRRLDPRGQGLQRADLDLKARPVSPGGSEDSAAASDSATASHAGTKPTPTKSPGALAPGLSVSTDGDAIRSNG